VADAHPAEDALLHLAEGDGDVDAALAAHVFACAECRARVAAVRAMGLVLESAAVPSRVWCPPRDELLRFAPDAVRPEGDPAPTARLRAHVAACPACRDEVRDLLALELAPDAPSPLAVAVAGARQRVVLLLDELRELGLRLLESTLPQGEVPVPVLARGSAQPGPGEPPVVVTAAFGAGELEVAWGASSTGVDLRTRSRGAGSRAYRVALSTRRPDGGEELWESRSSDEDGAVTLTGLRPGLYTLAVFGPQRRDADLIVEVELRGA
jgi:hypothetical protein